MAVLETRRLTFGDFQARGLEGRIELVNGQLEELVSPSLLHGWTDVRLKSALDRYLETHDPEGYWGSEVDIPTIPFHGRRPDFLYYSAQAALTGLDLEHDRVLSVPTLVVEIVSQNDSDRDLVTKRREYAEAGIPHYWILDPAQRTAVTLVLRDGEYREEGRFGVKDTLASSLFPGLRLALRKLFR